MEYTWSYTYGIIHGINFEDVATLRVYIDRKEIHAL